MLDISVCCKWHASQVLHKSSKEIKITGPSTANQACDWLWCYGREAVYHPSLSPDPVPGDILVRIHLKRHVDGKQFATDAGVKQALQLQYTAGIKALVPWWEKCLKMSIVIMCRSDVYHLLPMCQLCIRVGIKFSASECFFIYFHSFLVFEQGQLSK